MNLQAKIIATGKIVSGPAAVRALAKGEAVRVDVPQIERAIRFQGK